MAKIHQLSALLISKIAAGEVIERPSYALKELIENAIDANANDIRMYLEEAGLKKMQVVDNGEGMDKEDVEQSWHPHTTSKIKDESQLHAIQSLGFRGEALSSLAVVSELTIQSRTKKQAYGYSMTIDNGIVHKSGPVGMAKGTIVTAEYLFARMPARKKFLKSTQTELRHCIDIVTSFAASYPQISFTLIHGKRTLLSYPGTKDQAQRIEQLVGSNTFSFFIPVKKSESYIFLHGFIAKPQLHSVSQHKQFLFVNNRKISDKLISQAVKESFGTMLEATSYPLFVLFLSLPFEMVDVNVHPRKEQVSFMNNQFLFQTVKELITEVLSENNLTFENLSWKKTGAGMTKSYAGQLLKETVLDKEKFTFDQTAQFVQLYKVYIIAPTPEGLLLVDQHAAHERILFEKLQKAFITQHKKKNAFQLKNPVALSLTQSELLLLEEHKGMLEKIGFRFANTTITHLPTLFQDRDPRDVLGQFLEQFIQEKGLETVDKVSEEMLAFLACRAAVKAGDTLSEEQMRKILTDLENTPNNITCPHGRPTRILVHMHELDNLFGR